MTVEPTFYNHVCFVKTSHGQYKAYINGTIRINESVKTQGPVEKGIDQNTYLPTGPVEGIHNLTHLGEGGGAEPCPGVFGLKGTDC